MRHTKRLLFFVVFIILILRFEDAFAQNSFQHINVTSGHTMLSYAINHSNHVIVNTQAGDVFHNMESIIPADTIVVKWSFNEMDGDTLYDISGNENHGIINGASWVDGIQEGALSFDGMDDHVEIPDNSRLDITEEITIAGWIKPGDQSGPGYYNRIITKPDTSCVDDPHDMYCILLSTNRMIRFQISIARKNRMLDSQSILPIDEWSHIAVTYDGSEMKIYINGNLDNQGNQTGQIDTNDVPLYLGRAVQGCNGELYKGIMDEFTIFNKALSESEIDSIYHEVGLTGISPDKKISGLPNKFELKQNYPNPFNSVTTISYSVPNEGFVSLKIFDILGREIKTLISELQEVNTYSISFNASELSSGIYFFRLQVGKSFVVTKKMLLTR